VLTGLSYYSMIDTTGHRIWLNGVELKDVTRRWGLRLMLKMTMTMLPMKPDVMLPAAIATAATMPVIIEADSAVAAVLLVLVRSRVYVLLVAA
jgi:hypothetical protein